MNNSFDNSIVARRNILNNSFAVKEITAKVDIKGTFFCDEYWLTTQQVASFFEIDERTIRRYVKKYGNELAENGYRLISGNELKSFYFGQDIDVLTNADKTTRLGILNIKAFC